MKKIKKAWGFYLFFFVLLAFFSWYIFQLTNFPIFADEAIYLFWTQKIIFKIESPFISMFDGKPPLFMWLSVLISFIFPDLLFAGRLISVISLFIFIFLSYKIISKSSLSWAWSVVILILGSPFIFFHSRLALLDMLFVSMIGLALLFWSQSKLKFKGFLTGLFLGLAFWSKTPALFFLPLPLITAIIFKRNKQHIIQSFIAVFTAVLIILILKTNIWFNYLFSRSQDFSYSISQLLSGQFSQIPSNLKLIFSWLWLYLPWPILILSIIGLYQGLKQKQSLIQTLFIALILFLSPMVLLGKILASRYFLVLGIILPFLAAYSLKNIKPKILIFILSAYFIFTFSFNYSLQTDFLKTPLHSTDEETYLKEWSSGIGIKQASQFFQQQAKNNTVQVLTEGNFGTLPDGLFVSIEPNIIGNNLGIIGVGAAGSDKFIEQLKNTTADKIYYLGNQHRINNLSRDKMQLIKQYPKKDDGPPLELYQISKDKYD